MTKTATGGAFPAWQRPTTYYGWGGHTIDADHLNGIARKLRTYAGIYTGDKEAREMANWCERAAAALPHPAREAIAMSVELKPCPFCNSDDIHAMETSVFWYRCEGCLAEGAAELTKYGAITAWNTRAYEPDQARIAELETALRNIAEGNLGDNRWQANYARIKQVARAALEKRHD
ncbi:Lar family restriction alleviation protein [Labrys sedimenti]|uniref:Lar family restriction alleviation protein n=1 Tax=Labrys sedimenti TaxID=3106036 RepID=UPI002AC9FEF8|nr:Lar family restriction alleviation protein [Labrys sp. ZIDIC5]MDZ5448923.1 Lar family restriction alleviation protein [Labrys sp. ZIDIC5]